ncbi:MAG TPA: hypothetical protein VGY97_04400, partial [Solirubrobacteraceae bacterium]|nr:hypothetical protein [Solirubrobacteraceae bacterium]
DVEFRQDGWLRDLVDTAREDRADLVCAELVPERRNYVEPSPRRLTVRLMARPSHWLLLVDPGRVARLNSTFAYHDEPAPPGPESALAFDVGARLFRDALETGLRWATMPAGYAAKYHHYEGLSWPATAQALGFETDPYAEAEAKWDEIDRRLRALRSQG